MSEETSSGSSESVSSAPETTSYTSEDTSTSTNDSSDFAAELSALEASLADMPAPKTYRVKIDGQEIDVDESELLKGYQSTKSSQQKFNEAAMMRKQAEEFIKIAKSDPRKLLSHPDININLQEFANSILRDQIEDQMLSPEEKEMRDTRKKLAEYEAARKEQEEAAKQTEMDKYTKLYEEEYTSKIVGALETSGLPKTESTVKKMASMMLLALENGLDVQPADVVEFVRKDYIAEVKSLFGAANEDIILSLLGDDITNKVVKGHLKKSKPRAAAPTKMTELTRPASPQAQAQRNLSRDEWRQQILNRAKGG